MLHLSCGIAASPKADEQVMLQIEASRLQEARQQSNLCGNQQRYLDRMLVVPEKKLAFCYIEKVASAQFNKLIDALNHRNLSAWRGSSAQSFGIDPTTISRENGWFKGVFLRRPTERFLSAFLSKCTHRSDGSIEDDGGYCEGEVVPSGVGVGSAASVAAFEEMALTRFPNVGNPHFDPQRCFCGGLSGDLREFDYVGLLKADRRDVNEQVQAMLESAGVERASHLVDTFFPLGDSDQPLHDTHAERLLEAYYANMTILKAVEKIYSLDYQSPYTTICRERSRPHRIHTVSVGS